MSKALAVVLAAGLMVVVGSGFGQPGEPKPGTTPPAAPPATPVTPPAAVTPPPAPAGMLVPELPVVEKKELEGGLIIEDMKIGDGAEVKDGGAVVAFYHGTFKSDGGVFDSAFQRGEPAAFPLAGVIVGWQKGVPGMKVGGIRKLTVPYTMAYGENGRPPKIPAKADLVFVIQLVDALIVEDVKEGEGEAIGPQAFAATTITCKSEATACAAWPKTETYVFLPGETLASQVGLAGMKVGGKRKIHVPKQMFEIMNPQLANLPRKFEGAGTMDLEVECTAVRNLAPPASATPAATPAGR